MSRTSYGADIFSPIRSNDDGPSIEKESDFLEQFREPYDGFGKTINSEVKKNNSHDPFLPTEKASSKDNFPSTMKIDKIVEKKNKKELSLKTDLNRLSYVTTRKNKSSHRSKKELGVIQENQANSNDKVSKTRKKNFVTVRPEASITKELVHETIKQKQDSSLVNFPDLNKDLLSKKVKQNRDISSSLINPIYTNKESSTNIKLHKDPLLSLDNLVDSHKQISPGKIVQNKEHSLSLASLTDSNKGISSSKIRQNNDSSLCSVNLVDSNKISPCKQGKDSSSSVFNSADSKKELLTSRIKHNKDSSVSSIISADSYKELSPSEIKLGKDYISPSLASLAFNLNITPTELDNNHSLSKGLSQTYKALANNNEALKEKHLNIKTLENDSEASVFEMFSEGRNLILPMQGSTDEKSCEELTVAHNFGTESFCSCSDSKSRQVQRNFIEKLVKDTVSFEFDKVRQMLYLQQLQLFKYIDKNVVNSQLQKTIEKLSEENRRLKIFIAQQKT